MTTTTTPNGNTTSGESTDPRLLVDRAVATGRDVIAGIQTAQRTDPTPCAEMDVAAMIAHLIGVLDRITALGRGEDPFTVVEVGRDDASLAGWTEATTRARLAWADDTVLERPMALPWVEGTGADVLTSYLSELTVHTWDLATATGQRPQWDETVLAAALAASRFLPAENRLDLYEEISTSLGVEFAVPFDEAVAVAVDAPAIDRLVAWTGRDPRR